MRELTPEKLVDTLDHYLFGWGYRQIEQASIHGEAKLAGFILGACFIDAMAGFYAGVDKKKVMRGSDKRFKDFVKRYLTRYNPNSLYHDLRCGLVHSYAEGGSYVFTDANKAGFHFDLHYTNKTILNLEDFCADLREAYRMLRSDILAGKTEFENAKHRFESMGLMMLVSAKKEANQGTR